MEGTIKDYSQLGEQEIILKYFKDFKGVFLDIGANDGMTFSNTFALALMGWKGVCVEPNVNAFERLNKLYDTSEIECLNYCIGKESKEVDFFVGSDALVSSVIESETTKWLPNGVTFEKVKSKMITFAELLNKTQYNKFDFISIDVEGIDFDILSQINLTEVKMICVEVNERDKIKYIEYCKKYKMKLIFDNNLNLIFTK